MKNFFFVLAILCVVASFLVLISSKSAVHEIMGVLFFMASALWAIAGLLVSIRDAMKD